MPFLFIECKQKCGIAVVFHCKLSLVSSSKGWGLLAFALHKHGWLTFTFSTARSRSKPICCSASEQCGCKVMGALLWDVVYPVDQDIKQRSPLHVKCVINLWNYIRKKKSKHLKAEVGCMTKISLFLTAFLWYTKCSTICRFAHKLTATYKNVPDCAIAIRAW